MIKKIVLPTDFSDNAMNAIRYAIDLFKNEQCEFYILNAFEVKDQHNIEDLKYSESHQMAFQEAKEIAEKSLGIIMDMLSVKGIRKNHKIFMIAEDGNLLGVINDLIETKGIEMIIMGNKGVSNKTGFGYGSNTLKVMENVRNCPTLAIPENAEYDRIKEIVFATDYRSTFELKKMRSLVVIAKLGNSAIRLLHVCDEDHQLNKKEKANKKLLKGVFQDIEHSFHSLRDIGIETALSCFVQSRESDMISFIDKKHIFSGTLISKLFEKKLGYHSKVPTLVLHDLKS